MKGRSSLIRRRLALVVFAYSICGITSQPHEGGSACAERHKVLILRGINLLARHYLKNNPFFIPPNRLKCGIITLYESNAQTKSSEDSIPRTH
jgi:hypothetical protein